MDCLCPDGSRLLRVIPFWLVTVVKAVRPEVPPLLRDNLRFVVSHLLVFFDSLVLVNSVHELAHTGDQFPSQGLS